MQTTVNSIFIENVLGFLLRMSVADNKEKWEEFDNKILVIDRIVRDNEIKFRGWINFRQSDTDSFDDYICEYMSKFAFLPLHKTLVLDFDNAEVYLSEKEITSDLTNGILRLENLEYEFMDIKNQTPSKIEAERINISFKEANMAYDFWNYFPMSEWRKNYEKRTKEHALKKVLKKRGGF